MTTDTPKPTLSDEERADLKAKALKAEAIAPGTWEHDTEPGGGEYGSGPDARSGYAAYMMMDDKGRRLFGSDGSEVAEIHEEGEGAWDENSRRVFDFLAAANPSVILSLLASLEEANAANNRMSGFIATVEREREDASARAEKAEQAIQAALEELRAPWPGDGCVKRARDGLRAALLAPPLTGGAETFSPEAKRQAWSLIEDAVASTNGGEA